MDEKPRPNEFICPPYRRNFIIPRSPLSTLRAAHSRVAFIQRSYEPGSSAAVCLIMPGRLCPKTVRSAAYFQVRPTNEGNSKVTKPESRKESPQETSSFNLHLPSFPALGKNTLDDIVEFQTDVLKGLESRNQMLVERMRSEADLASEYMNKFSAVRSISETASVFQDYVDKRTKMTTDDAKRLRADNQELLEAVGRFWSKKWPSVDAASIGSST